MASSSLKFMEYMKIIGHLKRVERTGWVRKGVKNPESVAEHMYRMAMMAFAIPPDSGLDRDKCIKIALVHDMAESVVGDLTPWCGVSKDEKSRRENEATCQISSLISKDGGQDMYNLWLEYENQSSPEAKFVKDLDKLEMLYQAFEYETSEAKPRSLQEFYDYTKEKHKFSTHIVEDWCRELERERNQSHQPVTGETKEQQQQQQQQQQLQPQKEQPTATLQQPQQPPKDPGAQGDKKRKASTGSPEVVVDRVTGIKKKVKGSGPEQVV